MFFWFYLKEELGNFIPSCIQKNTKNPFIRKGCHYAEIC